ncbi:hypothetical protein [Neobacillus drentensis]|uniref:hypothetical protein n=1 Tax=Neobacillus drentensis TaxID=220684 RepID=UPI002FFD9615
MKQIQRITVEGIRYIEVTGDSVFIDFKKCNDHWLQYRGRTENLTNEEIQDLMIKDKTIGQRDGEANPPYFEFFTKPFTRIEFNSKNSFQQLRDSITASGWSTIDLS